MLPMSEVQEECLWTQDLVYAAYVWNLRGTVCEIRTLFTLPVSEAQEECLWIEDLVNAACVSEAQESSQEQEPALATMANAASLHTAEVYTAFSLGLKTISRPCVRSIPTLTVSVHQFHTPESLTPTAPNPIFRLQSKVSKTNMENNI